MTPPEIEQLRVLGLRLEATLPDAMQYLAGGNRAAGARHRRTVKDLRDFFVNYHRRLVNEAAGHSLSLKGALAEYHLPDNADGQLCRGVRVGDFASPCGSAKVLAAPLLFDILTELAEFYDTDIELRQGYVAPECQQQRNLAPGRKQATFYRYHQRGQAVDFSLAGIATDQVAADIQSGKVLNTHAFGLGVAADWLHLDLRRSRQVWRIARFASCYARKTEPF